MRKADEVLCVRVTGYCDGSNCAGWRYAYTEEQAASGTLEAGEENAGYCGLAGKPQSKRDLLEDS